jgi:hypothetical protein
MKSIKKSPQAVDSRIVATIHGRGRGSVFVPADFLEIGSREAVDLALHRLARKGTIRRLARGVYDFPKEHPVLGPLSPSAEAGRISAELTLDYAPFLVMQWMRTRTYRDTMREVTQKSMQSLADDLMDVNFPGEKKPKVIIDDSMAAMHSQMIFDQKNVERMSNDLERHLWVVGINNTEHLFYTSDHPVVRRGNRMHGGRRLVGVRDPGIEFAFPLDSRHILLIMERMYFAEWRKHDNRGVVLSADQVRNYNGLQVMRSSQRVFCANDDFELAQEVCAAHPEVRDPNRPRVRVDTTPILPDGRGEDGEEQWKNYIVVTALE